MDQETQMNDSFAHISDLQCKNERLYSENMCQQNELNNLHSVISQLKQQVKSLDFKSTL